MIAMLIMAFGLLGLASLQMLQIRNNQSAYLRSQATNLAYDMADRMRVNASVVYHNQAPTNDDCLTKDCTPAQMVGYDLKQWNAAVSAQLPGGVGVTCIDATPNDGVPGTPACDGDGVVYAIKIWWDDNRDGVDDRIVMSFQP